jgi:dynein heavy chain 2
LLTLPNGERIAFEDNVNFIFETHDLRWASPATISRMGMMFLSNEDINTKSLVDHWIRSLPEDRRELFQQLFEEKFEKCLNLLWKNENNMVVETTRVGTIKNVLSFLKEVQNKEEFQFRVSQGVLSNISIAKHTDVLKELNSIFGNELKS